MRSDIRQMSLVEFSQFLNNELSKEHELDYLILKGHTIAQFCMICYLEAISVRKGTKYFKRLSFFHQTQILMHFGPQHNYCVDLFEELLALNKLRNSVAHDLRSNPEELEGFINSLRAKLSPTSRLMTDDLFSNAMNALHVVITGLYVTYRLVLQGEDFLRFVREVLDTENESILEFVIEELCLDSDAVRQWFEAQRKMDEEFGPGWQSHRSGPSLDTSS